MAASVGLLSASGCSSDTSSPPDSQAADLLPDSGTGRSLAGRLLDEEGSPIPKVMLVLCGENDGVELCNQEFSGPDGIFAYTGLGEGFDHLQVLPYPSFHETGKPYCGMVLHVDLTGEGTALDLGDIEIPLAETTSPLTVATGGDAALAGLSVHVEPDSLSFPGLEDAAHFGIARVAPEDVPFSAPGTIVDAYSFHPFACGLTKAATARYAPDGPSPSDLVLFTNSTGSGELLPLDTQVDGSAVVADLSELTWVVVTVP